MSTTPMLDQALIDEFVQFSHQNLGKVKRLLLLHPELVDACATWGETAMEAAVHAGKTDIRDFLLSAGATRHECCGGCQATVHRLSSSFELPQ
ncbi:MAG: hypothetical protein GYB66_15140 [Chloroflexi bacterium]|nr:hypothetical protein [Chloroflexota bacterium]